VLDEHKSVRVPEIKYENRMHAKLVIKYENTIFFKKKGVRTECETCKFQVKQ